MATVTLWVERSVLSGLKLLVSAPALGGRELLQCLGRLGLAGVLFDPLATAPADPALVVHHRRAPEQVALDHQGIEACHVPRRLTPAQSMAIQGPSCGRA